MLKYLSALALVCLVYSGSVAAHTIRPALVTITFNSDTSFSVEIETNAEAMLARIGAEHADTNDSPNAQEYDRLRLLAPVQLDEQLRAFGPEFAEKLRAEFDGAPADMQFERAEIPPVGNPELARKSRIYLNGTIPLNARQFTWLYPEEYGSNV
ncbi:MAG: hypothetical protein ACR2P6_01110, partial [Gammaproteobacteria bacterium]